MLPTLIVCCHNATFTSHRCEKIQVLTGSRSHADAHLQHRHCALEGRSGLWHTSSSLSCQRGADIELPTCYDFTKDEASIEIDQWSHGVEVFEASIIILV